MILDVGGQYISPTSVIQETGGNLVTLIFLTDQQLQIDLEALFGKPCNLQVVSREIFIYDVQ